MARTFEENFAIALHNYHAASVALQFAATALRDEEHHRSPIEEYYRPALRSSLEFLDDLLAEVEGVPVPQSAKAAAALPADKVPPSPATVEKYRDLLLEAITISDDPPGPYNNPTPEMLYSLIDKWRAEWLRFRTGQIPWAQPQKRRSGPRDGPKDAFAVHSSAPVFDIGETIARGNFTLPDGGTFPTASIIGSTQGRIELLPFWDHVNNRPLTPQHINLMASAGGSEFTRMQEQAVAIATSYNEEMATYFYAMDAYWLMHAKDSDDYVELDISDLLQYTGKKPVKTHGKYTGTYRPDQLQRAGMMVYGMGFSMVEIERAVIKGVGERAHYKRLWDVSDMYVMETLDNESYIESMTYRPNEFFRGVSFGSRRETALLMSKVLGLDYAKMVVARRLGRYYTWLWRDRAYSGNIAAPISCARLLERAGIEVEKGKERFARRSLENALDRLETEGIIAQWVLLTREGEPVDTAERMPFRRWLEMKISVSPPDTIVMHYGSADSLQPRELPAGPNLDLEKIKAIRKREGYTLAMLSDETGVELSTLSRIIAGKTKRPRAEHVKALANWVKEKEKPAPGT